MYIKNLKYIKQAFRLIYEQAESLLSSGKDVDVIVGEHKVIRTNAQNNYYFKFNELLAEFLNDAGKTYGKFNIRYSKNLIHDINKHVFHIETTTKMTKGEFCDYMRELFEFWREETAGQFIMPETPEQAIGE